MVQWPSGPGCYACWLGEHVSSVSDGRPTPVATAWAADIPYGVAPFGHLVVAPTRTKTEYIRRPYTMEIKAKEDASLRAIRRVQK